MIVLQSKDMNIFGCSFYEIDNSNVNQIVLL